MADPAYDDDRGNALAAAHADFSDFEFEADGEDDGFGFREENFRSEFTMDGQEFDTSDVRHEKADPGDDVLDAEFDDLGSDGRYHRARGSARREVDPVLENYLSEVEKWKAGKDASSKSEFVNNADAVDQVREARLRHARDIMLKPHLIADPALGEDAKYLHSDLNYISRSDPSSSEYGEFMQRRAELRDQMFQGQPVLSADDYARVAGRAQQMISDESHLDFQYDLIDLRKEAALEHFDDPRFVVEVYRSKKGLMDELLVDFDRKDLLAREMSGQTAGRSEAMSEIFGEELRNHGKPLENGAAKIQNFQMTREVGINIRHNQRAIAGFADQFPENGVTFERGMAALDNVRWSEGMWQDYALSLPKADQKFIGKHKGAAAAFMVAREQFVRQFDGGDAKMAESFAVMEQAAAQIEKSPALQEKLSRIGDVEDVAAFHMFTEKYRTENLGRNVSKTVDSGILGKMEKSGTLISEDAAERRGRLQKEGATGDTYDLKMTKESVVDVVDGAHVRVANNAEDLEAGKGIVMRLDGIVAPPEGVSTKSGKLDAGLESKTNLEAVMKRHGVKAMGMRITRSEGGEETIDLRTADGESVSQRMLRDGYAIPTKDTIEGDRREYMTKQAEANQRGLWRDGFPDMDQSWRKEKNSPGLTWRDKRLRLEHTVNGALCQTPLEAGRNLSRSETKLFALPLNRFAGSSLVDREISKIIDRNPSRIMDIYNGNMEVLEDLRKRKDKLSQSEKQAHDQLSVGRRALGEALVSRNLMDEKKFKKDSHELLSRKGIKISTEGIRSVAEATGKVVEKGAQVAAKQGRKGYDGMMWVLDEAMR